MSPQTSQIPARHIIKCIQVNSSTEQRATTFRGYLKPLGLKPYEPKLKFNTNMQVLQVAALQCRDYGSDSVGNDTITGTAQALKFSLWAQAEAQAEPLPEEESELLLPGASTTTGLNEGSSFGIQIRGGGSWCTPPWIFIEHQVHVIEHQKINTACDIFW
jgi:hypothetical protein